MKLMAMVVSALPAAVGLADGARLDISGETARQTVIAEGGRTCALASDLDITAFGAWTDATPAANAAAIQKAIDAAAAVPGEGRYPSRPRPRQSAALLQRRRRPCVAFQS